MEQNIVDSNKEVTRIEAPYRPELPSILENASLRDFPRPVVDSVFDALKEKKGLYLWGDTGVGKTYLAAAIFNHRCKQADDFIKQRYPGIYHEHYFVSKIPVWPKWVSLPEFFERMKARFNQQPLAQVYSGEYELEDSPAVELAKFPGLLVLDDIGLRDMSEWAQEIVYIIVNGRYERGLRTIFTSNLSTEALERKAGKRTASRIRGCCRVIGMDGVDRRSQATNNNL